MTNITEPLRLAVGSHRAGSGKGCAMNVISWEHGDRLITDMPACADRFLARVVQRVNDTICTHGAGGLLCPDCSVKVLDLAHRTVGTGADVSSTRTAVWVQLAIEEAESVLPIFEARYPDDARPRKAIESAKRRVHGSRADAYAYAADAYAYAYAAVADAYAAAAAAAAADAYAAAADAYAADAYAYAAYAYAAAAYAAAADVADAAAAAAAVRLRRAHHLIDRFYELTGLVEHDTPVEVTTIAVERMLNVDVG